MTWEYFPLHHNVMLTNALLSLTVDRTPISDTYNAYINYLEGRLHSKNSTEIIEGVIVSFYLLWSEMKLFSQFRDDLQTIEQITALLTF